MSVVPKALLVLPQQGFDDIVYNTVRDVLESGGVAVLEASASLDAVTGESGVVVKPDLVLDQIKIEDWDTIVFIGGMGAAQYWEDPKAHLLVQAAWGAERVVAATDSAPVILANSGVLSGLKATVNPALAELLTSRGAIYTGSLVQRDGNVITARGPEAAEDFAREIVKVIEERKSRP